MKAALITGGSKGLGLALATSLVEDGWSVVIDGRDERALDEAVRTLRHAFGRHAFGRRPASTTVTCGTSSATCT